MLPTHKQLTLEEGAFGHQSDAMSLSPALLLRYVHLLMPSLLNDSDESRTLLDAIHHFVFRSTRSRDTLLEAELPDELYTVLIGLRRLLRQYSLPTLECSLEEDKKQFLARMEKNLMP